MAKKCKTCAKILKAGGRAADKSHDFLVSDTGKFSIVLGVTIIGSIVIAGWITGRVQSSGSTAGASSRPRYAEYPFAEQDTG